MSACKGRTLYINQEGPSKKTHQDCQKRVYYSFGNKNTSRKILVAYTYCIESYGTEDSMTIDEKSITDNFQSKSEKFYKWNEWKHTILGTSL